jgi:CTP:phosphocholine cytidylyltransferase-like protein
MKLFQTEEPHGQVSYINAEYIIDIRDNYNIKNIPIGSKVNVQGAMVSTFYDVRTPKQIAEILTKIEAQ